MPNVCGGLAAKELGGGGVLAEEMGFATFDCGNGFAITFIQVNLEGILGI
jgi:hypothetical protein